MPIDTFITPSGRMPAFAIQSAVVADDAPVPWRTLTWGAAEGEQLTISDLGGRLYEAFFLPGDTFLWFLLTYAPGVGRFFELEFADYGGVLSGFVSALAWLSLLLILGVLYNTFREADRRLTRWIANTYEECVRRARIIRITVKARWHERSQSRSRSSRRGSAGAGVISRPRLPRSEQSKAP